MSKATQLSFFSSRNELTHGGVLSLGKRKTFRPLATKKPIHVVMRSTLIDEVKEFSLTRRENRSFVEKLLLPLSKRYGIRLYRYSINSNHIHLLIRIPHRKDFQNFMRVLAGKIAQKITKAIKGKRFGKRFWMPVFTRIVAWGKAFEIAVSYIELNTKEAIGLIPYTVRKHRYRN